MFQAGYLTIDQVQRIGAQPRYRLRYPNLEVKASLNEALLLRYLPDPGPVMANTGRLYDLLLANDLAGLHALFAAFFASIPHDWYRNNPIAQYEGYYASVFYSHFAALGLDVRPEDTTSRGRIEMAVLFNGHVYLFEFKVGELTAEGKALQQLKDRDYAARYRARGEPIHLIGVEFSRDSRSVVGFAVETLT
jgi:hypothetical protein